MVIDPEIQSLPMGELKRGHETPWYDVTGSAIRQADGSVLVPVKHHEDPWRTRFVRGDPHDPIPVVASQQLTITHDAVPHGDPCPWCGAPETDGSPCPHSLVCPACMAEPGEPCVRESGHREISMHELRVRAAEGRP